MKSTHMMVSVFGATSASVWAMWLAFNVRVNQTQHFYSASQSEARVKADSNGRERGGEGTG